MSQKNIHITAICSFFEIYEIVPEKKAVQRLNTIKKNYLYMLDSRGSNTGLIVKTGVHNPTLF